MNTATSERRSSLKTVGNTGDCSVPINNDGSETHDEEDEHSWWASDSGSSTGSYYSETESSIIEWESEIKSTGEVFYIESSPYTIHDDNNKKAYNEHSVLSPSPPPELRRRSSTRAGKLMRLIRRRESKRYSTKIKKSNKNILSSKIKDNNIQHKEVKFRDCQAGEIREVMLRVDPEKRHKLGRRASLCEAFLGITPGDFSDKIRVMVAGFIPDGEAIKNKNIKIGDWLRSINAREITSKNLELILSEIASPTVIKLELQRVAGVEVTTQIQVVKFPKQTTLVRRLIHKQATEEEEESRNKRMESLIDYSFGVIYLQVSGLIENGPELQDVKYTYPRSSSMSKISHSILYSARGAFITLNHMLPETIAAKPNSTTISVGSEEIHVLYLPRDKEELFLMAMPARWYSLEESTVFFSNCIRSLEFTYENLNNCFTKSEHYSNLDHFFYLNFTNHLQAVVDNDDDDDDDDDVDLDDILKDTSLEKPMRGRAMKMMVKSSEEFKFENKISTATIRMIILPRDAQIQIDAALNEMEAMDYRDWNEDPIDCQRLYTILGSCLYHRNYLLASHLPHDDLIDVNTFLRYNGLAQLMESEPIKSLVIWKRVYPYSCGRNIMKKKKITLDKDTHDNMKYSKYFLLIVGFKFEFLAVLFESGGCTAQPYDDTEGPDIFYVEEAQETLKHIEKIGIPTLAAKWISANARPETILDIEYHRPRKNTIKVPGGIKTENFLDLAKIPDNIVMSPKTYIGYTEIKKIPEITSILKKKSSPEQSPIMSGSVHSLQTLEDSTSQAGTEAEMSEISDDTAPILGRRATRERNLATNRQSDDSDSDVDIYRNESASCYSTLDVSDIRENLLNQAEYIAPMKLTAGNENCLLHYLHLDSSDGILLSSSKITENLQKDSVIILTFNKCAYIIRKLLNNAVRFKKISNEDIDKSAVSINKNLVAVKEHGVLFEYDNLKFWVIGRLYAAPYVKEFYVCYEDTIPQNLVEMAFKLNSISS